MCAALALITASTTLHAQGVRGVVRGTDGRPLAGAEVRADVTGASASTDSLGRYALPRVQPGRTPLRVRLITYSAVDTTIVVPPSGWADVNVVMTRVAPMLAEVRAQGMQNSCDHPTEDGQQSYGQHEATRCATEPVSRGVRQRSTAVR